MKRKSLKRDGLKLIKKLVLVISLGASAALFAAESVTYDDLEGLRPTTGQNDFWDTSAHTTYTVQVDAAASSSALVSEGSTSLASIVTAIAKKFGLLFSIR